MSKSIYDETYRNVVEAMKAARLEVGMTQQQVADALGKPQSYVAKVEGCERRLDIVEFLNFAKSISWDPFPVLHSVFDALAASTDTRE